MPTKQPSTFELHCPNPNCQRFLCEVALYGRAKCRDCGWEIIVSSPEMKRRFDNRYPVGG